MIRPANRQDILDYYGEAQPHRMRAIVIDNDGVQAIAGIAIINGVPVAFSDVKEKPDKRTIVKAARIVRAMMDKYPVVLATADPEEQTAPGFLRHLGFETDDGVIYRWRT